MKEQISKQALLAKSQNAIDQVEYAYVHKCV